MDAGQAAQPRAMTIIVCMDKGRQRALLVRRPPGAPSSWLQRQHTPTAVTAATKAKIATISRVQPTEAADAGGNAYPHYSR
jgi:hypothetical protein